MLRHIKNKITGFINKKLTKHSTKVLCKAPFVSMSLDVTGFASACCYMHSQLSYFNSGVYRYPEASMRQLWEGETFARYRQQMENFIFPSECEICKKTYVENKNNKAKIDEFESYRIVNKFPKIIEITLENTCNLECIMCSSIHSSKIAKTRNANFTSAEMASHAFIEELQYFAPHLEKMILSGGEPFLSKTGLDAIKMLLSINPDCHIAVNTNGSILNNEIKALLEKGNFHLNISIDSFNKETYEKIRIGSNFENTLKNLEYFKQYSEKKKIPISIAVCPLVLNYREMPEIVTYCNNNGFYIKFVHVFNAHSVSLCSGSTELLKSAIDLYKESSIEGTTSLHIENIQRYNDFIDDLRQCKQFVENKLKFIRSFVPDNEYLAWWHKSIEHKIHSYLISKGDSDQDVIFRQWVTKKNEITAMLPSYFACIEMLAPYIDFDEKILLQYFIDLPAVEVVDYMITFGDEIISSQFEN